jgi:hypothetical protein
MSGRASVKGQGADIFFGEAAKHLEDPDRVFEAPEDEHADLKSAPLPSPESKPASKTTDQLGSQQTSLPASKQDSKQAIIPQEVVRPLSASTRHKLRALLEREHRTHNTYRYHDDELAAVRDIVYELEVRRDVKITRNDVMRAALLWAIEDYKERGEDSYLMQLLREGD